ncbi:MAG: hypothetical protein ACI8PZ_000928 [Myxococcota bacterium]
MGSTGFEIPFRKTRDVASDPVTLLADVWQRCTTGVCGGRQAGQDAPTSGLTCLYSARITLRSAI